MRLNKRSINQQQNYHPFHHKTTVYYHPLKGGSQEALACIYHAHFKSLYGYGMRIIRDEQVVKDAIQDLFYPNAVQVLDYFHAMEYLSPFAEAHFKDKDERTVWIKTETQLKEFILHLIDCIRHKKAFI